MRSAQFDVDAFTEALSESGLSKREVAVRAKIAEESLYRIIRKGRGDAATIERLWQVVTDRGRRVPIVDLEDAHSVVGEIRKNLVHTFNLPHRSVIVIVRYGESQLLCCTRDEQQRAGGRIDGFGEHERVEDEGTPENTLRRVMADEIRHGDRKGDLLSERNYVQSVRQIGGAYQLRPYTTQDSAADPNNSFEWSTLFGFDATVLRPRSVADSIRAFDETDEGDEKQLETRVYAIDELLRLHESNTGAIADGLAKVLRELTEASDVGLAIRGFLRSGHPE